MSAPPTLQALIRKTVQRGVRLTVEVEGAPALTKNGVRFSAMVHDGPRSSLSILADPVSALQDALTRYVANNFSDSGAVLEKPVSRDDTIDLEEAIAATAPPAPSDIDLGL